MAALYSCNPLLHSARVASVLSQLALLDDPQSSKVVDEAFLDSKDTSRIQTMHPFDLEHFRLVF